MGSTSENAEKGHVLGGLSAGERDSPVVCVVARDGDLEGVARTLLRASEHGFFTFVVVPESDDSLIGPLAERLDAAVIEVGRSEDEPPFEVVEHVARALDFPGVVYLDAPSARVDFPRCEEVIAETDAYSCTAPLVEESSRTVSTVAAIPAYNEADTIGPVVEAALEHADDVIVVDDGSSDDTVAVAERAGATVISHETNRGYGAALKTLFSAAADRDVDVLVTLDGDGQHEPDEIPKLLEGLRDTDANVVVGNRFHSDGDHDIPRYRRVGLFVINALTNLSLGTSPARAWVSDTQSGFRAYDERAISSLAADDGLGDDMSASTDILYHARRNGYDVEEVGTTIYYDGDETSTQNPLFHGFTVVRNILHTIERERPLTFVGLPGVATVLLGGGLGYLAIANYVQTGTFPMGIVLLCIFSTLVGVLLASAGIILHTLNTHIETLTQAQVRR
jgi:glycosyltransferase involved in cell wall biosynthesis